MLISLLRSAILYLVLILSVRLMGKRQIGEMEPSEFVMTMLAANLAAVPMQDAAIPLLSGLVPILTVLALELLLAFLSLRSLRARRLLCGSPIVLIEDGEICQQNLRRTRVTLDELLGHLRENGILDLHTVKYAILETNGQVSTFLCGRDAPPTARDCGVKTQDATLPCTVVTDGRVRTENLQSSGLDGRWLDAQLRRCGCPPQDIFLLTVDRQGRQFLVKKERRP